MLAAVLHEKNDVRAEEAPTPAPQAGEVLLRVAYCGVCGSDIPRLVKDGAHYFPIILGHEFSGVIEQVGEGVDEALIGKKAACAPLIPNFDDPECAKGHYSLGKGYDFIGSRRQGGFAEYVTMPVRNAVLLDDAADLLDGSFMEPLTVALHALNIMNFKPGGRVAVTGVGGIGLLMIQCLRELGAGSISAFDIAPDKLQLAGELGADFLYNSREGDVVETSLAEGGAGRGFDFVFETAGAPPAEILALRLAAPKGGVMFVGTPHTPLTLQPAEFELINRKELTLQGSWMNYSAPFPGWEWEFGAELFGKSRIETRRLVDKILPLSQAAQIPELLNTPGSLKGKLVVDCSC